MREFVKRALPVSVRRNLRRLLERAAEPLVQQLAGRSAGSIYERLERIERHVFAKPYVNPEFVRAAPRSAGDDRFDYYSFEEKFRGPSRVIHDKLRFYLSYVLNREVILDLGCGRGEFLDVLKEHGLSGIGVEIDSDQATECRSRGHKVVQEDLGDYLRGLPDGSVDAIFSAQVIEHVPFKELVTLFALASRKLKPDGIMIAETVNPHCTAAFKFFWLDPSHIAPLYPEVVHFLAESAGFGAVEIVYPEANADPQRAYHECGDYAVVAMRGVGVTPRKSRDRSDTTGTRMTKQEILDRIETLKPWFHNIDLGNGIRTQRDAVHDGHTSYPRPLWERVRSMLPAHVEGMRVLDVGCNAGFFSVEMKRLGASYVLGIEAFPPYLEQAKLVREALNLDIDLQGLSVYDVRENLGMFDIVLFLGVIYHLKHPLLALERLARVTSGVLVCESAIVPPSRWFGRHIPNYGGPAYELRFVENAPSVEAVQNWFIPSLDCLKAFLRAGGFGDIVGESVYANRALLAARRSG